MNPITEKHHIYGLEDGCRNLMCFSFFYVKIPVTTTDYLFPFLLIVQNVGIENTLSKKFNISCDECEGLAVIPAIW